MPEAIKWRSKIILAKMEAAYGSDPAPTGAANGILMRNVSFTPMDGEDVSRELELPYLGNQATLAGSLRGVLTGATELAGSGAAGTAPGWGVLARACALAETIDNGVSVTYSPVTDLHESAAIYFWIGNTRHVLTGVRGTGVVTIPAQGVPNIQWTLTGLWNPPAEETRDTPTLTGFQKPLLATSANTPDFSIDTEDLVLRSFALDVGNQVTPRLLIGREEIKIVNKAELITATVEAVPLSDFDPFALARSKELVAAAITHGTQAGNIVTVTAPTCEMQRPEGYENAEDVLEWPLSLRPLPQNGNDQFAIALT